ncbi:Ppx/GppA phosphatase family protein [Persephonella sp.]
MNYRIAVVDIGTYSTRLLISAVHVKETLEETLASIEDVFSVGRITALGRRLRETGYLQEEAINEVLSTLREYVLIAKEYGVEEILGYATQACREAKNGNELIEKIRQLGIDVKVISGEEEAYLSFLATAYGVRPEGDFVVIDQGGGSTEFVYGRKNGGYKMDRSVSFPFGIVSLTEKFIKHDPPLKEELEEMRQFLLTHLEKIRDYASAKEFIGLGGTITTLVALEKHIFPYVSSKVHRQVLSRKAIKKWLEKLSSMTVEERKSIPVIEDKRAEAIISGIVIFDTALDFFDKDSIRVSDWGLRHGAVIKRVMERFNV